MLDAALVALLRQVQELEDRQPYVSLEDLLEWGARQAPRLGRAEISSLLESALGSDRLFTDARTLFDSRTQEFRETSIFRLNRRRSDVDAL